MDIRPSYICSVSKLEGLNRTDTITNIHEFKRFSIKPMNLFLEQTKYVNVSKQIIIFYKKYGYLTKL